MVEYKKSKYDKYDFIIPEENVFVQRDGADSSDNLHTHDFYELMVVISGNGTHVINGERSNVFPGDSFLMFPGDTHCFIPKNNKNIEWIYCIWLDEFYYVDMTKISRGKRNSSIYGVEIITIMNNILCEFNSKEEDYLKIIRNYLDIIMIKTTRPIIEKFKKYSYRHKSNIARQGADIIKSEYAHCLKVEDISVKLDISSAYLFKIFKEFYGCGVSNFINNTRIEESYELLKSTNLTIKEIAYAVGFNDSKSYYVLFKKKSGITPAQFRGNASVVLKMN